eukprot:m.35151 g.35151  ORF g.35151 m.35151 type:complete len:98 (+) comp7413_c0_seq1:1313-1606(+)
MKLGEEDFRVSTSRFVWRPRLSSKLTESEKVDVTKARVPRSQVDETSVDEASCASQYIPLTPLPCHPLSEREVWISDVLDHLQCRGGLDISQIYGPY